MRKVVLAGALILAVSGAQAEERGVFGQGHLGVAYGVSKVEQSWESGGQQITAEAKPQVLELFWVGHLSRYVSLEGRFAQGFSSKTASVSPETADKLTYKLSNYANLSLVLGYPVGPVVPRVAFGYGKTFLKVGIKGGPAETNRKDDMYLGAGLDFHVNSDWGVSLDYARQFDRSLYEADTTIDTLRLGIFHKY